MFLRFPNKNQTCLVFLTKSWTRGNGWWDALRSRAKSTLLCSNHNFETFVLPESGNSVHFPNRTFPVQNLCFCRVINWGGLGRVMRGLRGGGVARHMSALLTTNRNQLIFKWKRMMIDCLGISTRQNPDHCINPKWSLKLLSKRAESKTLGPRFSLFQIS